MLLLSFKHGKKRERKIQKETGMKASNMRETKKERERNRKKKYRDGEAIVNGKNMKEEKKKDQ